MSIKITYKNNTTEIEHGKVATLSCKDRFMETDVEVADGCRAETWVLTLEDGSTVTKKVHIE